MPGFGHSDGRPELIAPDASGTFLASLIDQWGLGAPHVVGPDVGTAASLFLAAKAPERVTSLTVGGGAVRFPIEAGGALKDIIEAPSLDVVRGLDARTNIGYAVEPGAASESEPEVHEDYVSAYDLGRFAESARFVRHYPEQNPVLRDLLPTIATPTQILAGRDDDLVPWSNNQFLHDLLPNSEIQPLDAGHFAWEQAAEEYSSGGRLGQRRISARPSELAEASERNRAMPMIDVYAMTGTFAEPHALAQALATELMTIEQVPDIPMFRKNTAASSTRCLRRAFERRRGQHLPTRPILTNLGALDREKQLAVVSRLTTIVVDAAGDPSLTDRTWVLLTEAPDGGWGLAGHANTNEELVAAARAQIAELQAEKRDG